MRRDKGVVAPMRRDIGWMPLGEGVGRVKSFLEIRNRDFSTLTYFRRKLPRDRSMPENGKRGGWMGVNTRIEGVNFIKKVGG